MPPKKKKGKGKKKKKKDDAQLEIEDKYKKTMEEIDALKDHLAIRKEIARRSQATAGDMKQKKTEAETDLEKQRSDMKHISAEMTRQFKTMQSEMTYRIKTLENELERTQKHLQATQEELRTTQDTMKKTVAAKDARIKDLEYKIGEMEKVFDIILHDTLDKLGEKISETRKDWIDEETLIKDKNKQVLLEFGLNPLEI